MPQIYNDGVKIHFTVTGNNFPVVLHTGAGGDASMWEEAGYVEGLDGFQRILVDHRGHGRSDRPNGVENHLIDRYVSDVIAVLDMLGIERTTSGATPPDARSGMPLVPLIRSASPH